MTVQDLATWIMICCCATAPRAASGQRADADLRPLVVGTRHIPPFAIKQADGSWDGLSIELWREIAAENGWQYELREFELVPLLDAIEKGALDAAVAAVTVTHERERVIDFSHPFYSSGLGIAVRKAYRQNWVAGLWHLLAWDFALLIALLVAMTVFFGFLMWRVERHRNPEHFGGVVDGLGQGMWWAVVTMTTVGYGDKSPRTLRGRLIAAFWMFVGVVSLAVVTGTVASQMTVTQLKTPVRGPEDLPHVRSGTVKGTTSETYLKERGVSFQGYADEVEALKALTDHKLDAVVYDAPTLRYVIHHTLPGLAEVLPVRFQHQDYAIALQQGSPLRESINLSLTRIIFESTWENTLVRYMGRGS